ncbi:MAG: hypothetical protein ACRD0Y_04030 [Terriglobales bacterium]
MRTTVTLDGDVQRLLQDEMHRSRTSFKRSLNEAVRRGLASPSRQKLEPFVVKSFPMGLRPGIDPNRLNQLADELEDEALVARMRRAEAAERARQARARSKRRRAK